MLFVNIISTVVLLGILKFCRDISKDYYSPDIPSIEYKSYANFNKGDIIVYTDPEYGLRLRGMVVDIQNETYLIKWYGFHTALQNQTCLYINKSSELVSSM